MSYRILYNPQIRLNKQAWVRDLILTQREVRHFAGVKDPSWIGITVTHENSKSNDATLKTIGDLSLTASWQETS
jgi:hypothetical protein